MSRNQTWLMVIYELNKFLIFANSRIHFPGGKHLPWQNLATTLGELNVRKWEQWAEAAKLFFPLNVPLSSRAQIPRKYFLFTEHSVTVQPTLLQGHPRCWVYFTGKKGKESWEEILSIFSRILTAKQWKAGQRDHQMYLRYWLQVIRTQEESHTSSHASVT